MAARISQKIAAYPAPQALVGRDDEFHRGEPVGIEHDHRVRLQFVQHLFAQAFETGHQGIFLPVVQGQPLCLRQHDGGFMGNDASADDFTHL